MGTAQRPWYLAVAQAMTTGDAAVAPPPVAEEPGPRSWRRAFDDLRGGWRQRPLWGYLGWQDIKQRYRRSVLGPLWISITMGVIATAMGILYGALFHEPIQTFLPYVATGLLIWNFINGCILEGSEVFIANEGLIRFLPAPLTLHVYRLVWRQTLFFAAQPGHLGAPDDHLPAAGALVVAARDPGVRGAGVERGVDRRAGGHRRHPFPGHPADHREPHAAPVLHDADRLVLRSAPQSTPSPRTSN